MRNRISKRSRVVIAFLAATVLLSGCADSGDTNNSNASLSKEEIYQAGFVGGDSAAGDPVDGGTLTLADYSEARSLDPTKTIPNGAAGGNALAAVYDVLMRFDQPSNSFQPWLAKSLTTTDNTTWTLTLRDGVKFSDGTPLNARAVAGSLGYYMKNAGYNTLLLATNIKSMVPQGEDTVVFTLNQPWVTFPNMLASGPGMIMAPAAYAGGPEKFTAIGAGPFTAGEYKPAEEMVLKANPDYWNGKPHLDALRFVWLASDADRMTSLADGTVDAANVRAPQTVEKARKDGFAGIMTPTGLGSMYWLNNRAGRPGSDVRVRQAINYAIDPNVVAQRVNGGAGLPSRNIYSPTAPYYTDIKTADYDPEKAKELVAEAKADGFDGNVVYIGQSDQASQTQAVTVQAMLEAAGFTVKLDLLRNIADQTQRIYVTHDYDIAVSAMSIPDEDPYSRLQTNLAGASLQNPSGYKNADMDALLAKLQSAEGDEAKDLLTQINELWQETIPGVAMGAGAFFQPWNKNVHGVSSTSETIMLFGGAWKS